MASSAASSWPDAVDAPNANDLEGEAEFVDLYRAHFGFVWATLRRLGVPAEALDDAAQETFIVAYRRLPDFDGRSAVRTWLFGIARRVASGHRRRQSRRLRRLRLLPRPPIFVDDLDDRLERAQVRDLLFSFLEQLDPEKREAFLLGELEGLSRRQMGEVLRVSPNTAYSRLRAAREAFVEAVQCPKRRAELLARARERERGCEPEQRRVWSAMVPVIAGKGVGHGIATGALVVQVKAFVLTVAVGVGSMSVAKAALSRPEANDVLPAVVTGPTGEPSVRTAPPDPGDVSSAETEISPTEVAPAPPVQRPIRVHRSPKPASELALLKRARHSLAAGDPASALASLGEHSSKFVDGPLAPEREVLWVEALCQAGQRDRAAAHAESFRGTHPDSPLLARLEVTCVGG